MKFNETLFLAGLIDEDAMPAMMNPMNPMSHMKLVGGEKGDEDHPMVGRLMAMRKIEGQLEKALEKNGLDMDHFITWLQSKHD